MYTKMVLVSIGILLRRWDSSGVEFWMQRRQESGPLNGLWEFPGGKLEVGETPLSALFREISEETGLTFDEEPRVFLFKIFPFQYSDRKVHLYVHLLETPQQWEGSTGQWFGFDYSDSLPLKLKGKIPQANEQILLEVIQYLRQVANVSSGKTLIWNR